MTDNTFKIEGFEQEFNNINSNLKVNNEEATESKIEKISLKMYLEDWAALLKFRTHMVMEKKEDYSQAKAFIYGLTLLEKKYKIERGREKVRLETGPREKGDKRPRKDSSIDLPSNWIGFINDFLYYKKMDKGMIKYSRLDMISEIVSLIKQKNKNIVWD